MAERFTCFYPIFSLPPNIFHFNTALILATKEHIGAVIVIIPNLKSTYIDQDQCEELFELFGNVHPMIDIKIEKSQFENAFEDIQERFKRDPHLMAYIAITEKTARSSEFNSVFKDHHNLDIELIPSNFDKTSNKMLKAIETGDRKEFLAYIPEKLNPEQKEECWSIVHSEIEEQVVSKNFWKKVITEAFAPTDIFNIGTTGMPNYDAMIKQPAYYFFFKDQTIALQYMTPEEYMKLCAADVHDTTPEVEYKNIDLADVKALIKKVGEGVKLDTPILNVDDKSQEGRHRSIVAAHFGCDTLPVYIIAKVHAGKQKDATKIVKDSKTYDEAKAELAKMNVPLDEKTFEKVKWQEFKYSTENK